MTQLGIVLGVAALTLAAAVGGFFLRKRTSRWCPDCGGPTALIAEQAATELLQLASRADTP